MLLGARGDCQSRQDDVADTLDILEIRVVSTLRPNIPSTVMSAAKPVVERWQQQRWGLPRLEGTSPRAQLTMSRQLCNL